MTLMVVTTTVRLPEPLKAEAEALAESLGISMTALMAVALRDYLDRPATRWSGPLSAERGASAPPSPALATSALPAPVSPPPAAPKPLYRAPKSRSDPCPCGAREPSTGYPLKWKQCHGRG